MSSIKVWTSEGDWSTPINGCDKVHLMKEAIKFEFLRLTEEDYDLYLSDVTDADGKKTSETVHQSKLQIDNKLVDLAEFRDDEGYFDERVLDVFRRKMMPQASFFKMKLSTLNGMAKEDTVMANLYNKIAACAKVPSAAKKDYCLLMMFEDE